MAKKYDAIVVGAGIGGLAAALMLSHQGWKTLVLEKHSFIGGRLSSFDRDGFQVDLGVHLISRSDKGPVGDVLRRVGVPNPISYTHVRPRSCYRGKLFTFPHDLKNMVPEKDFTALMNFLGDIRAMPLEKTKDYDDISMQEFILQYTENPFVRACVNNVGRIYTALPRWLVSTGEFMRCLKWEADARATGYPEGGCRVISNTYGDAIRKFGGEIKTGAAVQKIEVENGTAKGVLVGDELYRSDVVISNADIKNTVLNLVGADHFSADYVDQVRGLKYGGLGNLIVRVALEKKLTDIKMTSQMGTVDVEGYYERLTNGVIPAFDELQLFMVIPSNFSTSVAPKGKQLVCMLTPTPGQAGEMKKEMTEAVLQTGESYIPGLRENAMWVSATSRNELNNMVGEDGAIIGIGQTPGQCSDKRPKIKTPIEGLYIVGGEAGGTGCGIELCINSAIEFMDFYCPLGQGSAGR